MRYIILYTCVILHNISDIGTVMHACSKVYYADNGSLYFLIILIIRVISKFPNRVTRKVIRTQ